MKVNKKLFYQKDCLQLQTTDNLTTLNAKNDHFVNKILNMVFKLSSIEKM